MMSIASFFARARWGSRWGVVDQWHRSPHKGLDVVHGARTPVPALRAGTIVADLPSSVVGRYIVVQVGPSDFDVYCHVITRGLKGRIGQGATLAYLAGYGDKHGTAWSGPHCHVCRCTTLTGWAYWGPQNRNPEPLILSILSGTATAGGDVRPIPIPVEGDMKYIVTDSGSPKTWALIDLVAFRSQGGVLVTQVEATAKNYSRVCPTAALPLSRTEFNLSVIAARLWVEQVVNASMGAATVTVDTGALAAELAPLLASGAGVTVEQLRAELQVQADEIKEAIPTTFTAA